MQSVLDVAARLGLVERPEVVRRDHALAELLHCRGSHQVAQLRLADKKALQQRLVAALEVREHAQLFDRAGIEVLRLVDDQQRSLVLLEQHQQEGFDRGQQARLVFLRHANAEGLGDRTQQVVSVELRADDLRGDDRLDVELLEQRAHQCGLAGADLARDDQEALALVHAVLQIRKRARVPLAAEVEGRVGAELERLAGKAVEVFVHGSRDGETAR